jgi:hypothetical protein
MIVPAPALTLLIACGAGVLPAASTCAPGTGAKVADMSIVHHSLTSVVRRQNSFILWNHHLGLACGCLGKAALHRVNPGLQVLGTQNGLGMKSRLHVEYQPVRPPTWPSKREGIHASASSPF